MSSSSTRPPSRFVTALTTPTWALLQHGRPYTLTPTLTHTPTCQLGFPFRNDKDLKTIFSEIDTNQKGRISELEFVEWWNKVRAPPGAHHSLLTSDVLLLPSYC